MSDFGNGHIWILDRNSLTVLGRFGEQGPEPGKFRNTHHRTTDSKGTCSRQVYRSRVHRFVFEGVKPQSATASR